MLDRKRILDDPQAVRAGLARRGRDYGAEIDRLCELDARRRELIRDAETLKAGQNAASKEIAALKKSGGDASGILAKMKEISGKLPELDGASRQIESEMETILLYLPNLPNPSIPDGKDSEDNVEVRRWGEPRDFGFEPKPHWELGGALGILNPAAAAKVAGARFHFYLGAGARLERALINLFMDTHASRGYTEMFPPFMANRAALTGVGHLPKFEEDMFHIDNTEYFMISTAEVPVTNYHREEILDGAALPLRYCAYSACFRAEAGAAGRDTRGLIRQHQFNKVELVWFAEPEKSYEALEALTADAEHVLQKLGLPHRTVALCAGDLGNSSAKTYDLEVWMPSYGKYVEISSCSNFEDYQARRANIRYRAAPGEKPRFPHTLNGSGVAIGRTVAAVMENYQNADGSITVPDALKPYMGADVIK